MQRATAVLTLVLSAAFAIGAATHAGVRLPLGVATIDEPTIVPAAIVEGVIAVAFAAAALAALLGRTDALLALRLALRIGIAGVLLGMFALAIGRGRRTELNDVFHVVSLIVMLGALRLTARRSGGGWGCVTARSRLRGRAT